MVYSTIPLLPLFTINNDTMKLALSIFKLKVFIDSQIKMIKLESCDDKFK